MTLYRKRPVVVEAVQRERFCSGPCMAQRGSIAWRSCWRDCNFDDPNRGYTKKIAATYEAVKEGKTADIRTYYGLQNGCHGSSDGECMWTGCPQLRDNEPYTTGRHCPLDKPDENR